VPTWRASTPTTALSRVDEALFGADLARIDADAERIDADLERTDASRGRVDAGRARIEVDPLRQGASVARVKTEAQPNSADAINAMHVGTWASVLGLKVLTATRDEVVADFEVQPVHLQPHGIVHGGVYSSVIESLASIGAALDAMKHGKTVVGLENHTSFVRAVRGGVLRATARPLTRGRRSQAWDVMIVDAAGALIATGRVRLLVLEPEAEVAGAEVGLKPA
jgi:1,4-dihydroxy-2-naphthoyl-CoA hydrolase